MTSPPPNHRGFEATRRHLDILSRFRRDVEDFCALLWQGLKPGLLFILTLRCLPPRLRPPARRFAALTFVSSLLWGVFLTGWEMTVDDGPKYFRLQEFVQAHAVVFSLLGIAVLALVILGTPQPRQSALPREEHEEEDDEAVTMQKEAQQASRASGSGEGSTGKSNCTRRRLTMGQERALRAAAEEMVSRSVSRATSRRGDGGGGAMGAGLDLSNSKGTGGGAAAAAAAADLLSGAASPARSTASGTITPQGSQRFFSADASQSGTPLRRSPRINSGAPPRRPPPLSLGLAAVAEGEEE